MLTTGKLVCYDTPHHKLNVHALPQCYYSELFIFKTQCIVQICFPSLQLYTKTNPTFLLNSWLQGFDPLQTYFQLTESHRDLHRTLRPVVGIWRDVGTSPLKVRFLASQHRVRVRWNHFCSWPTARFPTASFVVMPPPGPQCLDMVVRTGSCVLGALPHFLVCPLLPHLSAILCAGVIRAEASRAMLQHLWEVSVPGQLHGQRRNVRHAVPGVCCRANWSTLKVPSH